MSLVCLCTAKPTRNHRIGGRQRGRFGGTPGRGPPEENPLFFLYPLADCQESRNVDPSRARVQRTTASKHYLCILY